MKRFIDFSAGQLKFLAVLAGTLIVLSGLWFIRAHSRTDADALELQSILADRSSYSGVFVVDPNTSPADSLELLPGIGPVLANRIVAYRQHERFESPIDITNVKGIGPKLYQRLEPYLKVN